MHNPRRIILPILLVLILASVGIWYFTRPARDGEAGPLQASGTVEAVQVVVGPEIAGRVAEVLVEEGETVDAGDVLLRLDDDLLSSQRRRADTAVESARASQETAKTGVDLAKASLEAAKAALETVKAGVEAAQVNSQMVTNEAHLVEQSGRTTAWKQSKPGEFDQPVWYFEKDEQIAAAQAEVDSAKASLDNERANLNAVRADASNGKLVEAEDRLSKARTAFLVAKEVLDRANAQSDEALRDYANTLYDAAKTELDAAQSSYDNLLSSKEYDDVLEARARVVVAQERYQTARDRLNQMLTGEESLAVKAAEVALKQAESAVAQAEAGVAQAEVGVSQAEARMAQAKTAVEQAQAELDLIDVQIDKLTVKSPASGLVLVRNVEPGEVIQPGGSALTIGKLERLTITVYIPEDRYGQIKVGDRARVTVDSFPGKTFDASVVRVADRAEFTPRNVQTEEGRRTTVFAVELEVTSPQGDLKPGMPADVDFGLP